MSDGLQLGPAASGGPSVSGGPFVSPITAGWSRVFALTCWRFASGQPTPDLFVMRADGSDVRGSPTMRWRKGR